MHQFKMTKKILSSLTIICGAAIVFQVSATLPPGYKGYPYLKTQEIPGRFRAFSFDQGPKDVVWHDFNKTNAWYCKVRDSTGVGLQKMGAGGDKGDTPEADSMIKNEGQNCYLAETNMGDWTKYTVHVSQAGSYKLNILSAAQGTVNPWVGVSLLNGTDSVGTGQIVLPLTTYFHHWVYTKDVATMSLDSGIQVLRFDIIGNGPMNIDYIDFRLAGPVGINQKALVIPSSIQIEKITAQSHDINLSLNLPSQEAITVQLLDASGRVLANQSYAKVNLGSNLISLHAGNFKQGLVFVKVQQGKFKKESKALLF